MSLAVALNTARASLATTAKQVAVSGANIANADDPTRTRRIATPSTDAGASVRIVSVTRATDLPLFYRLLGSNSDANAQQALLDGLNKLDETVGDTNSSTSPAAQIAALKTALTAQANAPNDNGLAQATLNAAKSVASTLNTASLTVTSVRNDADTAMASSVNSLNSLLGQFKQVNDAVVLGTRSGNDVNDLLDKRDALLGQISEIVGVSVVSRSDNDTAIYTDSGVTLFDREARTVSFQSSTALSSGTDGNAVYIDGVPVTGANATMPIRSGTLYGLAQLRDTIAPTYQSQIDEMARGLVEAFSESDQSSGGGPDLAGLFTWGGGPGVPAAGTLSPGIAETLRVNPAVDPSQGGSLARIRDGGVNGANYRYNTSGGAAYSARLLDLADQIDAPRSFDASTGLEAGLSLTGFATASVSWLEGERKATSDAVDYQSALQSRTSDALSNATGVNIDAEYAMQLQLEQSYQASSKLIAVVGQMFQALLDSV